MLKLNQECNYFYSSGLPVGLCLTDVLYKSGLPQNCKETQDVADSFSVRILPGGRQMLRKLMHN